MNDYVFEAHTPIKKKALPWPVCRYCGLVYLHNDVTTWCIRKGCNNQDHPDYKKAFK